MSCCTCGAWKKAKRKRRAKASEPTSHQVPAFSDGQGAPTDVDGHVVGIVVDNVGGDWPARGTDCAAKARLLTVTAATTAAQRFIASADTTWKKGRQQTRSRGNCGYVSETCTAVSIFNFDSFAFGGR